MFGHARTETLRSPLPSPLSTYYIPANRMLVLTHIAHIPDCVYVNLQYNNTCSLKSLTPQSTRGANFE
jgi:hypothetical protein